MAPTDALQRKRLRFLFSFFVAVLAALVVFRLGYWMIIKSDWLKEKASAQWIRDIPIEPQRGNIEDRNGNILAASVTSNTVILHPKSIKEEDLDDLVSALHEILGIEEETIRDKATKTDFSEVWLKRQISKEQSKKIDELNSGGVSLMEDKKRYYPLGSFLTQVLGFTSVDGEGLEGIESRFDYILHGTPGSIITETDLFGQPLPGTSEEYIDPIEGNDLKLTIDLAIQSYTEKAMNACIAATGAKAVSAVVIDCITGEILAISNKPDFDNNNPPRNDMDLLRELTKNTAISVPYEPGTTFGLFTVAAAIDSGAIDTGYSFDCNESLQAGGKEIYCWTKDGHGLETLGEIFANGCNLAMSDISLKTGLNTLYDYIFNFGFGQKSGIRLYGESAGKVVAPKYIGEEELAKIGYGQGVKVTGIQMAAAISALVNGGNIIKPYIVKEVTSPEGETVEKFGSEILGTVISYETSSSVCELMYQALENGESIYSRIAGYNIGGFSGIAQKYDSNGTIIVDKHIATFAAAAPIEDPRIVVYIMVDEPEGLDYSSLTAAPYAKMILEDALPYLSIMPSYDDSVTNTVEMPDVSQMTVDQAESKLRNAGLIPIVAGYDGEIAGQIPEAGEDILEGSVAVILLEQEEEQNSAQKVEVPDLSDMSSIQAYEALEERGLQIKIKSVGSVVTDQYPLPGETAYVGDVVEVNFGFPPEDTQQGE